MSFTGKVAIVTGAATAKALAREGAKVVLLDINEDNLQDVANDREHGYKPLIITADVTKDEDIKNILKETLDNFNHLDILMNNAGIGKKSTIFDENLMDNFDHVIMNTNLCSMVYLTHLAAPYLIKTKGNIVNTSSICSLRTIEGKDLLGYSVSKAGVDHFTRCVALDLAPHGVSVNAVNPGPTKTNIIKNREAWIRCTAFKILSEPEEIAGLILFLASDKARSVTGSTYVCDNGALLT
ncbi:3-oxoacyl-[acyl-carrier-protein] reductase-like [Cydia amplana]|uniref:3-oxoacyl-[acyl-carrier-protein] reductase-like n=1 Tax=Cydia amplana TaxID=1869771 RepID=UPI002FE4FCE0